LFSEVAEAEANPTFKTMEEEYTTIIGELISIAVNVIVRITYDIRRAGWGSHLYF
jgi:hypothetical protein